jgi:hypothetical protein
VVVTVGETDADPDVAPPVEKPVPVQEVAFVDDHVSVEDWPLVMLVGPAEREAVGMAVPPPIATCATAVCHQALATYSPDNQNEFGLLGSTTAEELRPQRWSLDW